MKKRRKAYIKVSVAVAFTVCFIQVPQVRAEVCSEVEDEIVITSETVYDMDQMDDPESVWHGEDGTVYKLKFWEIEEMQEEARQENIRETVYYHEISGPEEADLFYPVSGTDERTGRTVTAKGQRVRMDPVGERWMEGVKVPLICYLCRDERNLPDGEPVIYNELEPPEEACREILRRLGISDEDYEISSITWEGEVFKSSDGYLCRMVQAEGRKRVRDYQVIYEGTVVYPEIPSYRFRAVYELEKEGPETSDGIKTEESANQAERAEEPPQESGTVSRPAVETNTRQDKKKGTVRFIKETVSITLAMGVPLILSAVLLWAISCASHKKK
ncbi:hypothetical protein [Clostridium sp. AM58-1XD]|uniref:hypothetical protein n=1 Tax=Clostridium sp. AM58-1XD TaxID=2292307 RepID=UPI000E47C61F|nr:hypothetical protein [Clostridium sp. AM58-1XD]RGY96297.1 hypothetical protein DXA13_17595 [Clostridium sp. AM58-1XD]